MSLRFQRLLLIIISMAMIFIATILIMLNAKENISYFYTPSELAKSKIDLGQTIRIGGFVEKNSFVKISAGVFNFNITDNNNSLNVNFEGILPDLFREGQGAVIEGFMNSDNQFIAKDVFAKHDENYMPASIKESIENKGYWNKKYK